MNNKITIKYEYDTSEITSVYRGLGTTNEFLDQIQSFMIAAGWHPESVKQAFLEKAEEIQLEQESDATIGDGLEDEDEELGDWGLKPGESGFYSIGTDTQWWEKHKEIKKRGE